MKLCIGGIERKDGWTVLNVQDGPAVDMVGDFKQLPVPDGSCETIYASHVLEHLSNADALQALKEARRALKPGGPLLVAVPDLEILCKLMLEDSLEVQDKWFVQRMMYGGQTDAHDFHYTGFTFAFMSALAGDAGFTRIERVTNFDIFNDTSTKRFAGIPISLNVKIS